MTELICPKCQSKLRLKIESEKDLGAKAWVKCPNCAEVFTTQQVDLASLMKPTQNEYKGKSRTNSIKTIKSVEKNKRYGDYGEIGPSYQISVTRSFFRSVARICYLAFFAIILLVSASWAFKSSVPDPPAQTVPKSENSLSYEDNFLVEDLRAIKQDLSRFSMVNKQVAFSGYESRIYLYFEERLAKYNCQEIVELTIYSEDTSEGFSAKGVCFDETKSGAEIKIKWLGAIARASADDEDEFIDIDLSEKSDRSRNIRGDLAES
ncbi:MAG: hypothetical protein LBI10_12605 [Deltaproteobacteria bacterium]|jgi:hypothetical protein|nr:hypothetical protein [Deltaproteobacteria bacterium]